MSTYNYIRSSGVRKLAKERGKHCGSDFLRALDELVYRKVINAIEKFNGHRKRLTADLVRRRAE